MPVVAVDAVVCSATVVAVDAGSGSGLGNVLDVFRFRAGHAHTDPLMRIMWQQSYTTSQMLEPEMAKMWTMLSMMMLMMVMMMVIMMMVMVVMMVVMTGTVVPA